MDYRSGSGMYQKGEEVNYSINQTISYGPSPKIEADIPINSGCPTSGRCTKCTGRCKGW